MSYNKGDYNDGWEGRTWFCDTDSREYNDGARDRACYDATQKSNRESDGDYGGSYDTDDSGYSEAWIPLTFFGGIALIGFLMLFGLLDFLINRYEAFHRAVRKKEFSVDREGLSNFYSILFFVVGIPLLIGAIIGFTNPAHYEGFSIWLFVAVVAIGIVGILYANISKRFIKTLENTPDYLSEDTTKDK